MKMLMHAKIILGVLAAAIPALADYTAWSGHRSIVLNTSATGANVAETVTNFPVLIRLRSNEADIIAAANGGNSIRFSKADDATALPFQIESWSSTGAAIWVLVDSVKGNNSTQTIRMHYGNAAAANESNGPAVFDTAKGFQAVWHLNEAANDSARDATGNRFHGAPTGAPGTTAGMIGPARSFDGASQHFEVPNSASGKLNFPLDGFFTFSAWALIDPDAGDVDRVIVAKHDDQYALKTSINAIWQFFEYDGNWQTVTAPYEMGRWTHLMGVMNGRDTYFYVDGVEAGSILDCCSGGGNRNETANVFIGRAGESARRWWYGNIDEVRIASTPRSAAWAKLEYENQKPVNSLANIGLPNVPGAPTAVTGTPGAVNSGSIAVSWTAPASNGGAEITSYKAMVVGDTAKSCITLATLSCNISGLTAGASYTFVVRASNGVGGGALSDPSAPVNAPTPILGSGSLMFNVGRFTRSYTFELPENVAGSTERLTMVILDVKGKAVWSKSIVPSETGRSITWNGTSSAGTPASAGIYFVRVATLSPSGKVEAVQGGVRLAR